jgi:hypothetical protein
MVAHKYVISYDSGYNKRHKTEPFWSAALRHRGAHAREIRALAAGGKVIVGATKRDNLVLFLADIPGWPSGRPSDGGPIQIARSKST